LQAENIQKAGTLDKTQKDYVELFLSKQKDSIGSTIKKNFSKTQPPTKHKQN
jgi:hypothetical protein